jgi:hypothetical protein
MRMRGVAGWALAATIAGAGLGVPLASVSGAVQVPAPVPVGRPLAPRYLTATITATGTVVLHWKAPRATPRHGFAADYLVIWNAPPIEPLSAIVDTHSTATTYVSHFGRGTYRVVAKNAAGTGPPSAPVQVGL